MSDTRVLVMIGRDTNGKPHAARFAPDMAEAAQAAAGMMGYHLVPVTDPAAVELASGLPEGKLFPTGKAFVPFTSKATFSVFAALVDGEIAPAPRSENARPRKPKRARRAEAGTGQGLDVGSVVLARSDDDGAWYEAVVTAVAGEALKVRWRDYPGTKPFDVRSTHVAVAPRLDD